jgi:hypothetical protein
LSSYWTGASWPTSTPGPFASNGAASPGTLPDLSSLFASTFPNVQPNKESTAAWGSQAPKPAFDGKDRVTLGDGWYLIRGEDAFFLELAGSGLDLSSDLISIFPNYC